MRHITRVLRKLFIAVIVLAAIGGIGFFVVKNSSGSQIEYITESATRGNIKQVVTANGTLNPTVVANVGTQVSGKVVALSADVNDEVKKGQLIAEIDPALIEAQLKQSRSSLEIARISHEQAGRDYRRSQQLFKKGYIARVEVEQSKLAYMSAKLSYESAKAQVESNEVNLNYTKITSPIDGVIIAREVTEGQTVAASLQAPTLFKIAASLVDMKIDVTIPESDIGNVHEGMSVTFTVDAYPTKEFEGVLSSVNINPNTGSSVVTYSAEVTLKNEDRLLFPGMTAYANITLEEKKDVLRIPAAALRFQPPKEEDSAFKNLFDPSTQYRRWRSNRNVNREPSVYVLRSGKPVEVKIKLGMIDEQYVEVLEGNLKANDQVIVSVEELGV